MHKKTEFRFQDTQARLLDVTSNAYVKPLTVELKVLTNKRVSEIIKLTRQEVEQDMKGDLNNIRSFAVYRASQLHDCDVIVAATFNVRTAGEGYEVNIIGYPANFVNWQTATQADYEIEIKKLYMNNTSPFLRTGRSYIINTRTITSIYLHKQIIYFKPANMPPLLLSKTQLHRLKEYLAKQT